MWGSCCNHLPGVFEEIVKLRMRVCEISEQIVKFRMQVFEISEQIVKLMMQAFVVTLCLKFLG